METEIDSRDEVIFKDFLSYLTDNDELKNLRARIKSFIDSELYFTNVPGNIKAKLIDYVDSRCSVWSRNFEDLATSSSREEVLGGYQKSTHEFKTWILEKIKDSGGSFEIKLPTAKNPSSNLDYFASLFKKWSDEIIDDTFSINWLDQIGITFAAAASETGYQAARFTTQVAFLAESTGAWWNNLWSEDKKTVTRKETKREPNFNRNEAFTSAEEKINILLSHEYLLDIYREGKKSGLLTLQPQQGIIPPLLENLIPGSFDFQQSMLYVSKAYILFKSISEAIAIDKSKKLCRSFCLSWKERKNQTLTAVKSSFTYWTTDTESVLKERYGNLMKLDPLVEAGKLKKIEEAVKQIESQPSLTVQDYNTQLSKVYKETLDEVKCSIKDRKLNESPVSLLPLTPETSPSFSSSPSESPVFFKRVTQLQVQTVSLIHLASQSSVELPQGLAVIHIGKPNNQIPPDIDLSGFPHSDIVSRIHADIRVEGDAYYLEDVGSANGTYVNHSPLSKGNRHRLRVGDRISFGKGDLMTFLFQLS
jgi:hypothetical protein